jgi:hypothetical protein
MIEMQERRWEITVQWRNYIATASSTSQTHAKAQAFEYAFKQGNRRGQQYVPGDECIILKISRSGIGNAHGRRFRTANSPK